MQRGLLRAVQEVAGLHPGGKSDGGRGHDRSQRGPLQRPGGAGRSGSICPHRRTPSRRPGHPRGQAAHDRGGQFPRDPDPDVGGEALIAFENVFVPWERVFMNGETEFTNPLVYRFAAHHRANYGGCKTGLIDVLTGAVAYLTQIQGTAKASHVRDKGTEMIHLGEPLYRSAIACAAEGWPTPSGAYMVDTMLANEGKHNVPRFHFEVARLAADLAGGFLATLPRNP